MSFYSGDWGHEFDRQIWRAVRIIKLLTQNNIKCNLWIYAKFKRQTGSSSTELKLRQTRHVHLRLHSPVFVFFVGIFFAVFNS